MKLSWIDWIWRVKGKLPIQSARTPAQVFSRFEPLLEEKNTTYRVDGETLTFTKKNQLPQDKLAVFDSGTLRVVGGELHYNLLSRALLACFLAPLFFFALGHIGVAMDKWRNPPEVVKAKAEAAKKRSRIKAEDVPMNPIDKFLGAPQPDKKKKGEEIGKRNRKPSMKTAYAFMAIFFVFWIAGRILEDRLVRSRLRKSLAGEDAQASPWAQANQPGWAIDGRS